MVDVRGLTDGEYEEFLRWVRSRKDYYERLSAKLERAGSQAHAQQADLLHGPESQSQNGELTSKIVSVMPRNMWVKNLLIRQALKNRYGIDIGRTTLREHLTKGEGLYFKRRGNRGSSAWKLIEKAP
jgi:hypothetical protein